MGVLGNHRAHQWVYLVSVFSGCATRGFVVGVCRPLDELMHCLSSAAKVQDFTQTTVSPGLYVAESMCKTVFCYRKRFFLFGPKLGTLAVSYSYTEYTLWISCSIASYTRHVMAAMTEIIFQSTKTVLCILFSWLHVQVIAEQFLRCRCFLQKIRESSHDTLRPRH
jgi:hypothetical protein